MRGFATGVGSKADIDAPPEDDTTATHRHPWWAGYRPAVDQTTADHGSLAARRVPVTRPWEGATSNHRVGGPPSPTKARSPGGVILHEILTSQPLP